MNNLYLGVKDLLIFVSTDVRCKIVIRNPAEANLSLFSIVKLSPNVQRKLQVVLISPVIDKVQSSFNHILVAPFSQFQPSLQVKMIQCDTDPTRVNGDFAPITLFHEARSYSEFGIFRSNRDFRGSNLH